MKTILDPIIILLTVPLAILGAPHISVSTGVDPECLRPGGAGDADWPGQQKRHSNCGICQPGSAGRARADPRRHQRRRAAFFGLSL